MKTLAIGVAIVVVAALLSAAPGWAKKEVHEWRVAENNKLYVRKDAYLLAERNRICEAIDAEKVKLKRKQTPEQLQDTMNTLNRLKSSLRRLNMTC